MSGYSVGQVAELTGVTVRALHHYDAIGLLSPRARTATGYRQYGQQDVDRLFRILFYRELGFALDDIATVLDDPNRARADHLREQHKLLVARADRLARMIAAVQQEMEAEDMGISLTPEEQAELFGDWLPDDYAEEAEARWGGTDAFEQSQQRVAGYTKGDWIRIRDEGAAVESALAAAVREGVDPTSEPAMQLAEQHRAQISRWFYDCGYDIHRGLGRMYVEDERFTAYYERIEPGLAGWLGTAIAANADRHA